MIVQFDKYGVLNQHISDNVQVIVEQLKNKIFASLCIEDALLYEEIHEVNL